MRVEVREKPSLSLRAFLRRTDGRPSRYLSIAVRQLASALSTLGSAIDVRAVALPVGARRRQRRRTRTWRCRQRQAHGSRAGSVVGGCEGGGRGVRVAERARRRPWSARRGRRRTSWPAAGSSDDDEQATLDASRLGLVQRRLRDVEQEADVAVLDSGGRPGGGEGAGQQCADPRRRVACRAASDDRRRTGDARADPGPAGRQGLALGAAQMMRSCRRAGREDRARVGGSEVWSQRRGAPHAPTAATPPNRPRDAQVDDVGQV